MRRVTFLKIMTLAVSALVSISAAAIEPSLHDVSQAVKGGDYVQAQHLMDEVLRAHPNSARAHFVEAQILARQGRMSGAESELAAAEHLNSTLSFARPSAVTELREVIERGRSSVPAAPAASMHHDTLLTAILPLAAILIALVLFARSRNRASAGPGNGTLISSAPGSNATGIGAVSPPSASAGSGILGSLATGAAMGAGMIAGESLMSRFLDGGHRVEGSSRSGGINDNGEGPRDGQPYDMGGDDFGVSDTSTWGDDNRNSSGDDWT